MDTTAIPLLCGNSTTGIFNECNTATTATEQQPSISGGLSDEDIFFIITTIVVAFGMIGIGASVDYKIVLQYLRHPKPFITGVLFQLIILPPLGWAFTKIFVMSLAEALGVFVQAISPGGNVSNLVVYWMGGSVDLSVTMTCTTTILSFGTIPLWLFIYERAEIDDENFPIPYDGIAIALASLLVPLAIGMVIYVKLKKYAPIISKILTGFASAAIFVLIIAQAVVSPVPWIPTWKIATVAALMPLVAFSLSYLIMLIPFLKLDFKNRITIAVETSLQNVQIAVAVALLIGNQLKNNFILVQMIIFAILYYIFQVGYSLILIGIIYFGKKKGCISIATEEDTGNRKSNAYESAEEVEMKNSIKQIETVSGSATLKGADNPVYQSISN